MPTAASIATTAAISRKMEITWEPKAMIRVLSKSDSKASATNNHTKRFRMNRNTGGSPPFGCPAPFDATGGIEPTDMGGGTAPRGAFSDELDDMTTFLFRLNVLESKFLI